MPPEKHALRREMRARLRMLEDRAEKSRLICAQLAARPAYRAAQRVAIFDAMNSEPDVPLLWTISPKSFVYPRIEGSELVLHEVVAEQHLQASAGGAKFREPVATMGRVVQPAEIDLILVPGLAFTRDGHRLGRGGGYYDRLLAQLPARTVKLGVCFSGQLVPDLPLEPHDIVLDDVVTELSLPPALPS